jgi:hypothetical protein
MQEELESNLRSLTPKEYESIDSRAYPSYQELLLENQRSREEKDKLAESLGQVLEITKEQEAEIAELRHRALNNHSQTTDVILEKEVALLYRPLQEQMISIFKLKDNKVWLTIRFNKNTGEIIAIYLGRKSQGTCSKQSIVTRYV